MDPSARVLQCLRLIDLKRKLIEKSYINVG